MSPFAAAVSAGKVGIQWPLGEVWVATRLRLALTMSISQRVGVFVVALFALAFTRAPRLVQAMNPLMNWLLSTRLPGGPNAVLHVRGRRSGRMRSVPVSVLELMDRLLIQASDPQVDWVRNLRAAGAAELTRAGRRDRLTATELDPDTAGRLLYDMLRDYPRSRFLGRLLGKVDRPPIGVLAGFRLRIDEALDDYVADARRHPLFELRRQA